MCNPCSVVCIPCSVVWMYHLHMNRYNIISTSLNFTPSSDMDRLLIQPWKDPPCSCHCEPLIFSCYEKNITMLAITKFTNPLPWQPYKLWFVWGLYWTSCDKKTGRRKCGDIHPCQQRFVSSSFISFIKTYNVTSNDTRKLEADIIPVRQLFYSTNQRTV